VNTKPMPKFFEVLLSDIVWFIVASASKNIILDKKPLKCSHCALAKCGRHGRWIGTRRGFRGFRSSSSTLTWSSAGSR